VTVTSSAKRVRPAPRARERRALAAPGRGLPQLPGEQRVAVVGVRDVAGCFWNRPCCSGGQLHPSPPAALERGGSDPRRPALMTRRVGANGSGFADVRRERCQLGAARLVWLQPGDESAAPNSICGASMHLTPQGLPASAGPLPLPRACTPPAQPVKELEHEGRHRPAGAHLRHRPAPRRPNLPAPLRLGGGAQLGAAWADVRAAAEEVEAEQTGGAVSVDKVARTHFLGAIVLERLPVAPGRIVAMNVIDGQQRPTTLLRWSRCC